MTKWLKVTILALFLAKPGALAAQDLSAEGGEAQGVPERGEPVKSMSFPDIWKPQLGLMLNWDREGSSDHVGLEFHGGVYYDLMSPAVGALGVVTEGYVNLIDGEFDGGLRLMLGCRFLAFQAGVDYAIRDNDFAGILSWTLPIRRGGVFGRGGMVRFDWIPRRGHSFSFGLDIPFGQPWMGTTRPQKAHVNLPKKPKEKEIIYEPDREMRVVLDSLRSVMYYVEDYTIPFFDDERDTEEKFLAEFHSQIDRFKKYLYTKNDDYPNGHTFEAEIDYYHRTLERAFFLAAGGGVNLADDGRGIRISAQARTILLDEVILPYNRIFGQRKRRDSLHGLGAQAEAKFAEWIEHSPDVPAANREGVIFVFRNLISYLDEIRAIEKDTWEHSRLVWLSLHLALRPEEHDTQQEMNALIERAVQERFTTGNDVHYVINEQFQYELARMIQVARDYHILWIHDYKGKNANGDPDKVAYLMTLKGYLAALTQAVKDYDSTGKIPLYIVILDQFYFEMNKGKLFLEFLENPLDREFSLPDGFEEWEENIRKAQEDLRSAVAGSSKLTAGERAYGRDWLLDRVKVHINITNPADFSFRSSFLIKYLPAVPDMPMRDHRKISFYDVTELDPARGEAIYTGMGVGEHYAGPSWEDRALLARGPALVGLKDAARELLLSQGFTQKEIPPPLREMAFPDDYDAKVAELVGAGWNRTAMQVHNLTGYGMKKSNIVRALLYNLMPAGSHIYVPDSLWNSFLWGGMLIGAAMRGCSVFVIAPSFENAPSDGIPQMSRANELFTRFVILQKELEDEFAHCGGLFKTGVYDIDADVQDQIAIGEIMETNFKQHAWLHDVIPFDQSAWDMISDVGDHLESSGYKPVHLTADAVKRKPKLHQKVQFFASRDAIHSVIPMKFWGDLMRDYVLARAEQVTSKEYVDVKSIRARLSENTGKVVKEWRKAISPEDEQYMILYLTVGSHNEDYRGKVMDGEASYIVAHLGAYLAYLDFVRIMGLTTWVESAEELNEILPAYGGFKYKLSRYIKLML